MKRILTYTIIIAGTMLSFSLTAQRVQFSDTSNLWDMWNPLQSGAGQGYFYEYYYEDTVVEWNGKTYNLLNCNGNRFLARDTNNKVYVKALTSHYSNLRINDTTNEFVCYDYDLQVNDTFSLPIVTNNQFSHSEHVITAIDSFQMRNEWYKRFAVTVLSGIAVTTNYYIYEGIGTVWGPFVSMDFLPYQTHLICFKNNNSTPSPFQSRCDDFRTSVNDFKGEDQNLFYIYPNPTNGLLNIGFVGSQSTKFQIRLFDLLGKQVLQPSFHSNTTLDLQSLQAGIYVLQIENEGQVVKRSKIIITK